MLPSHSSIYVDSIRRKKIMSEIRQNTQIVLQNIPKKNKLVPTSIVVVNRQVFINDKEIELAWTNTSYLYDFFTAHFKNTLCEALMQKGFEIIHRTGGISIYKYSS